MRLLTVATWEPRKNLPRLLRAVREAGRRSGLAIELTMVGQRGHFKDYVSEVEALVAEMPTATIAGSIADGDLAERYASSHASIYPSLEEGFGLPIGESLWLATPCICHSASAMAEVAPGGGTLMVDMNDDAAITATLLDLVQEPGLLDRLSAEAVARPLGSWHDYARTIASKLLPDDGR